MPGVPGAVPVLAVKQLKDEEKSPSGAVSEVGLLTCVYLNPQRKGQGELRTRGCALCLTGINHSLTPN